MFFRQVVVTAPRGGGLTRNPRWPLQESPGWEPDALRSAGVAPASRSACWTWPQFCGGAPPGPGNPAPSPSSRPEKAQIELAWDAPKPSPPAGWPLPLISPALAVLAAPPSRIAVANTVAAAVRNRIIPPEDDAAGAETVLETGRSSARTAPLVPISLTWTSAAPRCPAASQKARGRTRMRTHEFAPPSEPRRDRQQLDRFDAGLTA